MGASRVLTINGGSSSIKFAVFSPGEPPVPEFAGSVDRIGAGEATFSVKGEAPRPVKADSPHDAAALLAGHLDEKVGLSTIAGIGHRIVHGGDQFTAPLELTPAVVDRLRALEPLSPSHMPAEVELIDAFARQAPGRRQFGCFDTAFHKDLPPVARTLPIARRYIDAGVRRYGFHGLSYEFLLRALRSLDGDAAAEGRVVLAHLGNGASLCAVRGGRSVDTSMGFTPCGGTMMGTRTGDLDPGVVWQMVRQDRLDADRLDQVLNHDCGLKGVSGVGSDMRDLMSRRATDPRAALAVEMFCYSVRKWIGSFAAVLGGIDTLVFAGGIGEHVPAVRTEICRELGFLGVVLDSARNDAGEGVISADGSRCRVRVIPTDEQITIARAVYDCLNQPSR